MHQKGITWESMGALILKHFEMTDVHVKSSLQEKISRLTPNICLRPGKSGGGKKVTIVFHLRFLIHSVCQCDVTQQRARALSRLCKLARETAVIRTSEVEEKLRS